MEFANSFETVPTGASRTFTNKMPKRDSHTHRILCNVLGRPLNDESAPNLEKLPADVLHKVQEVLGQNRDLKENLPHIQTDYENIKATVKELKASNDELKDMFKTLLVQIGGGKREAPATESEQPKAAKRGKKAKMADLDDPQGEDFEDDTGLPPAEK